MPSLWAPLVAQWAGLRAPTSGARVLIPGGELPRPQPRNAASNENGKNASALDSVLPTRAEAARWLRGEDQVPQLPAQIFAVPTPVSPPAALLA